MTSDQPLLHQRVLDLYIDIFESSHDSLEVLAQLEMTKMVSNRMVHLLSRGCIVPVVKYMRRCFESRDTDMSLIRYFVTEVLDVVSQPFTEEFVQLFYPLVSDQLVTGSMRTEAEQQLVSEFIGWLLQYRLYQKLLYGSVRVVHSKAILSVAYLLAQSVLRFGQ